MALRTLLAQMPYSNVLTVVNPSTDLMSNNALLLVACRWAFSIWGVIFALQGAGVIYAALPRGYTDDGWKAAAVNAIGKRWCIWASTVISCGC